MSNDRVIIIVLGEGNYVNEGWTAIHTANYSQECTDITECIHNHISVKDGKITSSIDYDLVICRENYFVNDNVNNLLNNITAQNKVVAIHKNATEKTNYETFFRQQAIRVNLFSRYQDGSDKIWNNIKPVLECIVNHESCVINGYKDLFDNLWAVLAPSPVDEAHSLRAEILTPFVPFHLYYQIDNEKKEDGWKDILKSCCMEINKEDNGEVKSLGTKLDELLKLKTDLPENMKTAPLKAFYELKEYFMQDEDECIKTKDSSSRITKFADCLENVVNYVEFGDTSECL